MWPRTGPTCSPGGSGRSWRPCRRRSWPCISSSSSGGRWKCPARTCGTSRSRTCTSTASGSGCGGTCCLLLQLLLIFLAMLAAAAARLAEPEASRQPLHLPGRQFGQHAGHRRGALAAGRGQAAGRQTDRPDALRRRGDGHQLCRHGPTSSRRFTDDRRRLRRSLEAIRPTQRRDFAAGGAEGGLRAGQPGPHARHAITQRRPGGRGPAGRAVHLQRRQVRDAAGFSLGNLEPEYHPIGTPEAANVGIVAMSVRRHETKTDQLQAFARLQNFGKEPASVSVELLLNDSPDPVRRCSLYDPAGRNPRTGIRPGIAPRGRAPPEDEDGRSPGAGRRCLGRHQPLAARNVLLVTPGNPELERNMGTSPVEEDRRR